MQYNEELVKKVREGRLAIYNDGTLEELRKLLHYCFPEDVETPSSNCLYYSKCGYNLWIGKHKAILTSKSVKEFYMKETKYTKEDWINGKVALEWENDKAEKINKFFKECNKSTPTINGQYKYYTFVAKWVNPTDYTTLPKIKIDDIVMEEKEQFPKDDFGVIVENNNGKEIVNYLISKNFKNPLQKCGDSNNGGFYYILKNDDNIDSTAFKNPTSKTYTLEQLKQLDSNMETKKNIIGYKLIKPEYEEAAKKIAKGCYCNFKEKFNIEVSAISQWKEAGVLDIWFTPVFKEEKKLPKIGSHIGKLENGIITYGCQSFSTEFVKTIANASSVDSITIKGQLVTKQQLQEIVEFLKEN